jgi:hypothetical protein
MANQVLVPETPTPSEIVWAAFDGSPGDFSVSGVTATHLIDLSSLASDGYRQGQKADLGIKRAELYVVELRVEFDVAPTSGNLVHVWLAWSRSSTAGSLNPGGADGTDSVYSGTAGDSAADSIKQLDGPYTMIVTSDSATTSNIQTLGIISASQRYVSPVIHNAADQAFEGDAVEMYLALRPFVAEVQ